MTVIGFKGLGGVIRQRRPLEGLPLQPTQRAARHRKESVFEDFYRLETTPQRIGFQPTKAVAPSWRSANIWSASSAHDYMTKAMTDWGKCTLAWSIGAMTSPGRFAVLGNQPPRSRARAHKRRLRLLSDVWIDRKRSCRCLARFRLFLLQT